MREKPLNNTTLGNTEFFYNQEKATFQQVIEVLFKNYIKSRAASSAGEKI